MAGTLKESVCSGTEFSMPMPLIEEIYESAIEPDRWAGVMKQIAELTRSRSVALFVNDKVIRRTIGMFQYGLPRHQMAFYNRVAAKFDPSFRKMASVPVGQCEVILDPDLGMSVGEKAFFHLMVKPANLYRFAGASVLHDKQLHAGLALHRSRDQGPFESEALALVESLAPHLERALRIYRELVHLHADKYALQSGLENLASGVLFFDDFMQVIYSNPMARTLLDEHPGIALRNGRLIVNSRAGQKQVYDALQQVSFPANNEPTTVTLGLHHPKRSFPLAVTIKPGPGPGPEPGYLGAEPNPVKAIMYLMDPERAQPVSPKALGDIYSLSPMEASIALGLANGASVEELASLHHIQPNTVRTHLKNIYRKTTARNQADLVRLVIALSAVSAG